MYPSAWGLPRPEVEKPTKNPDREGELFCPLCGEERFQSASSIGSHQTGQDCKDRMFSFLEGHAIRDGAWSRRDLVTATTAELHRQDADQVQGSGLKRHGDKVHLPHPKTKKKDDHHKRDKDGHEPPPGAGGGHGISAAAS